MTFEEKKEEYARLIVKAGVHVRKDQVVYVGYPIEAYEFARLVIRYAYEEGAKQVIARPSDGVTARLTLTYAPMEVFENVPSWEAEEMNTYAKNDVAFIRLIGEDPEIFKGTDPAKMKAKRIAQHKAMADYYHMQSVMGFKWHISAVPTEDWAKKVFPAVSKEEAMNRLWDAIFHTVRVGNGDAFEQWMAHADDLKKRDEAMTKYQFESLHYKNSLGTDFTVGLVENHRWEGGADCDKKTGDRFFANMPTEECFTMPHREKAEGKLVASMPLSYNGVLIEDFSLTFHNGEVVEYDAKKGKEALTALLTSDEGSRRLGECALVPFPNPVSEQNILFLETLFDENAACHFALGACYETNLVGGEDMSEEELLKHGANQAVNHVDFMVGTKDLTITGRTKDGKEIPVFENGTWAF